MKKNNDNQPTYETMPEHFIACFNNECPMADTCLRQLAVQSKQLKPFILQAVNYARQKNKNCNYYKENKLVTMAYGMVHSFHEVKADHISQLRNTLINYFGRGSYYLRRNGLRVMPPEEQKFIASVFRKYGYEVKFDRTEVSTAWV